MIYFFFEEKNVNKIKMVFKTKLCIFMHSSYFNLQPNYDSRNNDY